MSLHDVPADCPLEWCGHPQDGPGHPRKGSVLVKRAGEARGVWCCSFHCAGRYAIHRELGGAA